MGPHNHAPAARQLWQRASGVPQRDIFGLGREDCGGVLGGTAPRAARDAGYLPEPPPGRSSLPSAGGRYKGAAVRAYWTDGTQHPSIFDVHTIGGPDRVG